MCEGCKSSFTDTIDYNLVQKENPRVSDVYKAPSSVTVSFSDFASRCFEVPFWGQTSALGAELGSIP